MIWSVFGDFIVGLWMYLDSQGFVLGTNWEERLGAQLHVARLMMLQGIWRNLAGHVLDWILLWGLGIDCFWIVKEGKVYLIFVGSQEVFHFVQLQAQLRDNRAGRGEISWSELRCKCLIKGNRFCRNNGGKPLWPHHQVLVLTTRGFICSYPATYIHIRSVNNANQDIFFKLRACVLH